MECVPNFSEGRDPQKINAIAEAIQSVNGAHLLNIDSSPAANRTVMTLAGEPEALTEAAFRGIRKAAELIDMRVQAGVHPRIGATDVCPLVPLANMTMEEADHWARKLGARVGNELNIPVYLYEHSQINEQRSALPDIRKGHYEGFAEKMKLPDWQPDFGPALFNEATGATVMGARDVLVAFNISLKTKDVSAAMEIATLLRSRKYKSGDHTVEPLFKKTRAIGWYMADYEQAQVSFNLLDYRITSPLQAFEACRELALIKGIEIAGSEVIGLLPESCLLEAGTFSFLKKEQAGPQDTELLIEEGIAYMGLDKLKVFQAEEKILERALRNAGLVL